MNDDVFLEDRLWPWLADESMADSHPDPSFDEFYSPPEPEEYCDDCGAGLFPEDAECPDCGKVFP